VNIEPIGGGETLAWLDWYWLSWKQQTAVTADDGLTSLSTVRGLESPTTPRGLES
jgi:hypothetical protein